MEGVPHDGQPTTLVTSLVGGASESATHLVDFQLDVNPIDRPEMDITVKAALRSIQITNDYYHMTCGCGNDESIPLTELT